MADRTVVVRLTAMTSQFTQGMSRAGMSVNEVNAAMKAAEAQATRTGRAMEGTATRSASSMVKAGAALRTGFITGAVVGLGVAVKSAADFEQAMSKVAAVSGATKSQLKAMGDSALDMGPKFGFSAKQAAGAQEELAKAGLSVQQIMGGAMTATMSLAAAGDLQLSDSARIAAVAMNQFHMAASDLPHVADLLARGANQALGDVSDLGTAFRYVGPEAHALGISVDTVVGSLALLAQNGIQADMAGTSLRGTIMALTSPSRLAKKTMDEFGISVFDTQGKFIGLEGVANQLKNAFGGLTDAQRQQAMGRIFANAQMQAAQIFTTEGGQAIADWTAKVNTGADAAQVAAAKLDNLSGDVRKLGGAIQADMIHSMQDALPVLRGLTEGATGMVKAFGGLSGPMQGMTLGLAGMALFGRKIGDTFGKAGGGLGKMASSFDAARNAQLKASFATRQFDDAMLTQRSAIGMTTKEWQRYQAVVAQNGGQRVSGSATNQWAEEARAAQEAANVHVGFAATLGRLSGEFTSAGSNAGRFGAVMTGLGSAAKGAGSALLAAAGGWPGLLITGAIVGISMLAEAHAKAAAAAKQEADAENSLAMALADSGGKFNDSIRRQMAGEALSSGLLRTAHDAGVSLETITRAVQGNQSAYEAAREGLQGYFTNLFLNSNMSGEAFTKTTTAVNAALDTLDTMYGRAKAGSTDAQLLSAALATSSDAATGLGRSAATAGPTLDELAGATQDAGNAAAEAAQQVLDFGKAWNTLFAGTLNWHQAATEAVGKLADIGKTLKDNGKSFSLNTEKGRANRDMLDGLIKFSGDYGDAATKAARDRGESEDAAIDAGRRSTISFLEQVRTRLKAQHALTKSLDDYIRGFENIPATAGGTPTAPKAGKAPVIKPLIDMTQAKAVVDHFGATLESTPKGIKVTADTKDALNKIGAVDTQITKTRDGKFTVTFANEGQFLGQMALVVSPRTAEILAEPKNLQAIDFELDAAARDRKAWINAFANTAEAEARLNALTAARNLQVTVNYMYNSTGTPPDLSRNPITGKPGRWGLTQSYAQGGTPQASVAPGGPTLYQWAEPQTGGEAFIPRLGNKSRSKSILDTAAGWYGMKVMPLAHGGVVSFASGGVAGQVNAPLSDWFGRWGSPGTTKEDYTKAVTARLAAINAVHKAEDKLHKVQADRKHTTAQLAAAERDLTLKHRALDAATDKLSKTTVSYNLSKQNAWERFRSSTKTGVGVTGNFIANLNKLANRGFGQLANQLLAMGGADAEAIASGAVKASDATVRGTAYRVSQGIAQQKALDNMPATLSLRGALRSHTSYESLVGSGQVDAASLNAAITLMQGELSKTSAGRAMIAAMNGANAQALKVDMAKFATGGIAPEGTMYRFAEPGTGGEAVIPRMGSNALPVLAKAAAWHGMTLSGQQPWDSVMQRAGGAGVQITVRGEGVLAGMIEATVDGKMVQVARAVRHGTRAA